MLVEVLTPERIAAFMERVIVDENDELGCWIYTGDPGRARARITIGGVKAEAYRWSWAMAYGKDPDGLLLHSCDTSRCVNPSHLREGTWSENNQDAVERGRVRNQYSGKKQCVNGHKWESEDDLYVSPSGKRECRECKRNRRKN